MSTQLMTDFGRAAAERMRDGRAALAERWIARLALPVGEALADRHLLEHMTRMLPGIAAELCADEARPLWSDEAAEERLALIGRTHAQRGGDARDLVRAFSALADVLGDAVTEWLREYPPVAVHDHLALSARLARIPVQMAEIALGGYLDGGAAPGAAPAGRVPRTELSAERLLAAAPESEALVERIRRGIAAAMHFGLLRTGDRLPSVRAVATAGRVDHRAVGAAYRALVSSGVVEIRGRQGAYLAAGGDDPPIELGETAEWARDVLTRAAALRIRASQVPMLLQKAVATPLCCLCVESVEDELVALAEEASRQWGMTVVSLMAAPHEVAEIAAAAHEADVILTTAFMAQAVEAAGRAAHRPVVVVAAAAPFVEEVVAALAQGPLTVVVADPAYAERLRVLANADRLVVHVAECSDDARLPPDQVLLATAAARKRLGACRLRLLVAPSDFVAQEAALPIAALLVGRNMGGPGYLAAEPATGTVALASAPLASPE